MDTHEYEAAPDHPLIDSAAIKPPDNFNGSEAIDALNPFADTDPQVQNSNRLDLVTYHSARAVAGVGHNSDVDAKNVSPIDISEDIASVDQAIREVDDAETAAEQLKLPASYAALARIFALILKIVAAMPLQHFCVMMGIEIHGNTKNNLQPIVAWLWRTYKSEYVRQVVWRWSAVLAVALEGGVPVEEFPQWIEKNGIGPMVRLHQERKKQTVPAADAAAEEIIAQGMCAQGEDAPRLSATQLTRNEDMGRHIAVIEIHPQGEFQLLTLLPATPEQIRRMLVNLARKRQSRGA